jgi:SAM-dependent methyltransferase
MPAERALLDAVGRYYSDKVAEFGATPAGVDWNGRESQELRFAQLLRIAPAEPFTVNDIGCGYGSLVDYLERGATRYRYAGIDLSSAMVEEARRLHAGLAHCRFAVASEPPEPAEFCVASGIFNVKLDTPDARWLEYILETLRMMDRMSTRGFAFNCLTRYSDAERMRPNLFYADPCFLFDHCKRAFSRQVALLHDYGLYEFTVLVRK